MPSTVKTTGLVALRKIHVVESTCNGCYYRDVDNCDDKECVDIDVLLGVTYHHFIPVTPV